MIATDWMQRLTSFDRKLLVVIALFVASSFLLLLGQKAGARVVVSSEDQVIFVAPLSKDQQVELNGPLGITVLEIKHGGARIISSPCSKKVCIRMGEARHTGDLLACVPNQLMIHIEGDSREEETEYDFIQR